MDSSSHEKDKRYPLSLLCAAEAAFGPDIRLRQLTDRISAPRSRSKQDRKHA